MADAVQYVTLGIAEDLLAVPVERVREILEVQPISRLPHAPVHLLGMIDVRGQGVPVIDLRMKLGFEKVEDTENTRIIVLNVTVNEREVTFGLKTDRVFEVTVLDEDRLEAAPEIGTKWRSEFIAGIGRRHGKFVTVLELGRLFASEEAALADSHAA
ncbi:chemotaxis protein CheW [Pelagibacterium halotolerans]|uniref:chemotaxis protein CheW n=1 Tax=Pelagibacterium halotolerans TaxID=531813 RepID=UPI00384B9CBB